MVAWILFPRLALLDEPAVAPDAAFSLRSFPSDNLCAATKRFSLRGFLLLFVEFREIIEDFGDFGMVPTEGLFAEVHGGPQDPLLAKGMRGAALGSAWVTISIQSRRH